MISDFIKVPITDNGTQWHMVYSLLIENILIHKSKRDFKNTSKYFLFLRETFKSLSANVSRK